MQCCHWWHHQHHIIAMHVTIFPSSITCKHKCQLVLLNIWHFYVSIYASYEPTTINNMNRNSGVHSFYIIGICPCDMIYMGRSVHILVRHSVVISLLTLVLQKAQDWYIFAHHHFILYRYICYIGSCVVVPLNLLRLFKGLSGLWLQRALNTCWQVYFGVTLQGWQVTTMANLTNWKYMPQLFPPLTKGITSIWVELLDRVMPCNINF